MKKLLSIIITVLSIAACTGTQTMTPEEVSDQVSLINSELPQKIDDNIALERVSYNKNKSIMVCHYKLESWDNASVVALEQSRQLFCEQMDQKHRSHLFSMADTIEFEFRTADGGMQYAFAADKDTCKE